MQFVEVVNQGLKREYRITIPQADVEGEIEERLKHLASSLKLAGFRPGKIPIQLVKQRYGQDVQSEVKEKCIKSAMEKLLKEKQLKPALQPKISIDNEDSHLEFSVAFEVIPEVQPNQWENITFEKLVAKVGEDDLREALDRFTQQYPKTEPVKKDRPVKEGDIVVINFEGRVEGKVYKKACAQDFYLEIGSKLFVPGFEDQLVGLEKGQTIDISVHMPAHYNDKHMEGKEVIFHVELREIRERVPVTIDDELAKKMGAQDLKDLREKITKALEEDFGHMSRTHLKKQLLDYLDEANKFAVPEEMVELEFRNIWHQLEHELAHNREFLQDKEEALNEETRQEYRSIAERRVRLGLLLAEIGRYHKIDVTNEELAKAAYMRAQQFPGKEKEYLQRLRSDIHLLQQLRAPLFEEKVVDFMLSKSLLTEKEVSAKELRSLIEKE